MRRAEDSEERPSAGRVLVVDDEPQLLRALRHILSADGHRVEVALSPEQAGPALARTDLDVVLLDLSLGPASGLELLRRIARERPELEVVVMTGDASIESAVHCMRRGASDYLAKPFADLRALEASVRRAVERRRRRAAGAPAAAAERTPRAASEPAIPLSLDAYEARALRRALRESGGDAAAAAHRLGIGRSTFYRKLAKHGLAAREPLRRPCGLDSGLGRP